MQDKVYANGISIECEGLITSCQSPDKKLDLLFYNRMNKNGDVLTSLVYNSGVLDGSSNRRIHYEPAKLLRNTEFELSYNISGPGNRWLNSDIVNTEISLFKNKGIFAKNTSKEFDVINDYAVVEFAGSMMYDGWYSLVSIALPDRPNNDQVPAGTLRLNQTTGIAEYALVDNPTIGDDWSPLNEIDASIPIYNMLRMPAINAYRKEDFFVYTKLLTLYKKLLNDEIKEDWYYRLSKIKPKVRTISAAVEAKEFAKAQLLLQSMDLTLLTLLV